MTQYTVTGMSCAACQARVEKAVSGVAGVESCAVNLLTHSMGVEGSASPDAIISAVEAAGYGASLKADAPTPDDLSEDGETRSLIHRLVWSVGLLLPLMYISMGHTMWGWPLPVLLAHNPFVLALIEATLAAAVMVVGRRFFISGVRSALHLSPNMDTLVSLGSGAAFVYSACATVPLAIAQFSGDASSAMEHLHGLYFESAAMILALITVGKLLESRAKGKTTDALRTLMRLAPDTATVLRDTPEGEVEAVVPVTDVQVGDRLVIRPGERVPVDGVVLSGESAVDESPLTGESIPVDKSEGDTVSAATLNRSGYLVCRAARVGEDTTLSGIIRMVSDAAATKAPIAQIADTVSGIFVPIVLGIALVTTIVWLIVEHDIGFALARGISVLVISCPCALGLATPVAITVGSGVGAKNGILFKTAVALENAGRVDTVVLDKTGTVTEGRPRVTDIYAPADGEQALLQAAASLEKQSEHPLAHAIVAAAGERDLILFPVSRFEALHGRGLGGYIHTDGEDGYTLIGGNHAYVSSVCRLPEEADALADRLAAEGKTPLFFAREGEFAGMIAVADTVKEDSAAAIRDMEGLGLRVVMLTGDNPQTAAAIGRQAGIAEENIIAGVLPDGKEAVIRALQAEGKVAMVGDGINDAPALTRADVGLAIGAGTDVAIDAADVVLIHSRLSDVPTAIRLSRATLRNIKENLFWAFCYNALGIPLAAGVFIPLLGWELEPMFGAAAMSLSSFCVVTNALRLSLSPIRSHRAFRRKKKIHAPFSVHPTTESTKESEEYPMKKLLKIEGMMCPRCEAHVKKALEALDGVASATPNHTTDSAEVILNAPVEDAVLKAAVEAEGYTLLSVE